MPWKVVDQSDFAYFPSELMNVSTPEPTPPSSAPTTPMTDRPHYAIIDASRERSESCDPSKNGLTNIRINVIDILPSIEKVELTGGPFHTTLLSVKYDFKGGNEGDSMFQWQFSKINDRKNSDPNSFTTIPGATKSKFYPNLGTYKEVFNQFTPFRLCWTRN